MTSPVGSKTDAQISYINVSRDINHSQKRGDPIALFLLVRFRFEIQVRKLMRLATIFLLLFHVTLVDAAEIVESSDIKVDCSRSINKTKCLEAKVRVLVDDLNGLINEVNKLNLDLSSLAHTSDVSHKELRDQVAAINESYESSVAKLTNVDNHNDSVSAHQGISQNLNDLLIRVEKLQAQLDANLSVVDKLGLEFRRANEQRSISDRDIKESFKEHERVRDETKTLVDQRLSGLEERLSSYADTYVKDSDLSRKLGGLSLELNTLSDLNKSLDERFKTAEGAIQTITTQLIDQTNKSSELRQRTFETSDRIAALDQKLLELDRLKATMEVLEGEISSNKTQFMTLFDELSSLSAVAQVVDINRDTLSKHNDSLRQILVDYESIQKQLFRLDSEAKRLDDLMAFNKVDIESMLKRLDELEIIQPELSEQSFLRDRLSEIQYKQSMMDEDKSLIAELQSRVLSLEAKLERFENLESKILTLEEKLQNFESNQQMADPANSPTSVPE